MVKDVPTVHKTATRGPVEFENTLRVGDRRAVELKGLVGGLGGIELDKTIAGITGLTIANDFDIDGLTTDRLPHLFDKILVHPGLKLAHPRGEIEVSNRRGTRSAEHGIGAEDLPEGLSITGSSR